MKAEIIVSWFAKKYNKTIFRKGLKNYRTFDQAKELADEVGMVLNDTILNTGSSMALSIYNPKALASLLADNDEEDNKADIIAQFKSGKLNQAIN